MGETEAGFQVLSFILSLMIWAHWEKVSNFGEDAILPGRLN